MADSHTLSGKYTTTLEDKLSFIQRKTLRGRSVDDEDRVGLIQLLKKGGPQRFSIPRIGTEGQSRTDTGLPPPVHEFVGRRPFSYHRAWNRAAWYARPNAIRNYHTVSSRLMPPSLSAFFRSWLRYV